MKIVIVDGQGGRMGAAVIQELNTRKLAAEIVAVGTNSIATSAMLSAKPTAGATGENAVIVNCRDADFIIGPIGILVASQRRVELFSRARVLETLAVKTDIDGWRGIERGTLATELAYTCMAHLNHLIGAAVVCTVVCGRGMCFMWPPCYALLWYSSIRSFIIAR